MQDPAAGQREVARAFTSVSDSASFDALARLAYASQKALCAVYRRYEYTYLPIAAFRHAAVTSFDPAAAALVFESSGTTHLAPALHHVRDERLYNRSVSAHFRAVFGAGPFTLLAHLPTYRNQSSLIHMARSLIAAYGDEASGFFLEDPALLEQGIHHSKRIGTPFILLGAAFGLLRLVEERRWRLPANARVIETGGMKTFRQHLTRHELHKRLAAGFGIARTQVWSEYGMCELMSQAYTRGGALFYPPPWMRVGIFAPDAVEEPVPDGTLGVIGVIDLANIYSVSALMTEDLGCRRNGGFEVLGRLPQSALRGCNFLFTDV